MSANSLPFEQAIHSQARQAETRHIMAGKMARQPAPYDLRRPGIVNRGWAQAVEAKNGFVVGTVNRKKCFRTTQLMALPGVTAQEFVQCCFAAVERFPIMVLANRLFVPCRHNYDRFGNARAALSSFAFGAGGFSSRLRTRKLSLPESWT